MKLSKVFIRQTENAIYVTKKMDYPHWIEGFHKVVIRAELVYNSVGKSYSKTGDILLLPDGTRKVFRDQYVEINEPYKEKRFEKYPYFHHCSCGAFGGELNGPKPILWPNDDGKTIECNYCHEKFGLNGTPFCEVCGSSLNFLETQEWQECCGKKREGY